MLRQSAPAAGGLQRGDFPRLTFLHHLTHGISEPQGWVVACLGGGLHDLFLRGLGCFGGFFVCFVGFFSSFALPWLQPLPVSGRRKKQTPGGEITNQTEPSPGRAGGERPGRSRGCSRGQPSTAPAPRRADPARILHVSFLFFLPPFFFSSPSIFSSIPPSLPSLPSVVGSVFWYFLPPPPPPSSCPAAARRSALSVPLGERLRGAHACPLHPIPRVSWRRRCGRRGGGGGARRAEGGRPDQVRRAGLPPSPGCGSAVSQPLTRREPVPPRAPPHNTPKAILPKIPSKSKYRPPPLNHPNKSIPPPKPALLSDPRAARLPIFKRNVVPQSRFMSSVISVRG